MKNKIEEKAKEYADSFYNYKHFQDIHPLRADALHLKIKNAFEAGALSQQEPIKGVEELKQNLVAEIYSLIPNRINNNAHATQVAESIIECLEPYLRTSNTQNERISKDYANWLEENMWCKSRDTRFPKTYGRWYNTPSPNIEKEESRNDDELFAEFQNSKSIKQTKE